MQYNIPGRIAVFITDEMLRADTCGFIREARDESGHAVAGNVCPCHFADREFPAAKNTTLVR